VQIQKPALSWVTDGLHFESRRFDGLTFPNTARLVLLAHYLFQSTLIQYVAMPIALHVAHYLSRTVSDEAFDITVRWTAITVAVVCAYWYGRIEVSTIPQGRKRWLFYVGTPAMHACVIPELVSLAFNAVWCGDATARQRNARVMEAARVSSS